MASLITYKYKIFKKVKKIISLIIRWLEKTLKIIQERGHDGFYKGEIAQKLAAFIQKNGGFVTEEDLARYQAVWRDPVRFNYKYLNIIAMATPSSGGVTMNQIFKIIEPYDLAAFGHNSE